jgi:predicted transcriptional regulator
MKPYCEITTQIILPAMRALVAKNLIEKYKLNQQEAASKLGVTQAAISQYRRDLRGSRLRILEKDKNVMEEIERFTDRIVSGGFNSLSAMKAFCDICRTIRSKKLICEAHMKNFPELKECKICFEK